MKIPIKDVWKIRQFPPPLLEKMKSEEEKAKAELEAEGETPEGEKPEEPELDELSKKSREELDTIATEKGIDPGEYPKKKELAKAISEKEVE